VHFITAKGKFLGNEKQNEVKKLLQNSDVDLNYTQLNMFSSKELITSVITGEL
jgi:hypothetical protein